MKTLKLILFGMLLFFAGRSQAQVSLSLNVNGPPLWGPSGYTDVRFYYLPDVQAYYDVHNSMFIYSNGGKWIRRSSLPYRYRNYDLYSGYKVVLNDYRGNTPYTHYSEHRRSYGKGYRGQEQRNIGERPERGNNMGNHRSERQMRNRGNQAPDNRNRNDNRNDNRNNSRNDNGNSKGHQEGKNK